MTRRRKRYLVLVAGWSLILLGVAGLFLPFLQGVVFLLAGLWLLSFEYAWARKLLRKLRERFPTLSRRMNAARNRARARLKQVAAPKADKSQG